MSEKKGVKKGAGTRAPKGRAQAPAAMKGGRKAATQPPAKAAPKNAGRAAGKAAPAAGKGTMPTAKTPGSASPPPGRKAGPAAAAASRPGAAHSPAPPRAPQLVVSRLEAELASARERIELLLEDRDNQVALAEAADTEREILQGQLAEALERVRSLEERIEASPAPVSSGAGGSADEDLHFEEEDEVPPPEEMDDVETLYSRMDDPRVRRGELDRERIERESESSDESWWMVCPKCGDSMDEVEGEDVKLERCESCGGIYLDRGEVEMLLSLAQGRQGLQRVRNVLSI